MHPTGPLDTVDDAWKAELREVMKAKGWNQGSLAEKIPVSPASITNMFKPGPRQIRFKARIEELCGWTNTGELAQVLRRVERKFLRLSLADAERIEGLVNSLAKRP